MKKGIDLVRYAVHLLDRCKESVNQRFNAEQLLTIADCCQRSEWDMYPDQWTDRQLQECVQFGKTPQWHEVNDKIVPKYSILGEDTYEVACTWTTTATITIYANSLQEAIKWAEGDCGIPKNGEYLDDSFEVDLDATSEMNQTEESEDE